MSGHETRSKGSLPPCQDMKPERVGFSKQDARGNLVVKTPISVSGHETRSTAIPKLGKTRISVSGHETQSNH
jgi:hypothetical protein